MSSSSWCCLTFFGHLVISIEYYSGYEYYNEGPITVVNNQEIGTIKTADTLEISFDLQINTKCKGYCHILSISDQYPLIYTKSKKLISVFAESIDSVPNIYSSMIDGHFHTFYFKYTASKRIIIFDNITYINITNTINHISFDTYIISAVWTQNKRKATDANIKNLHIESTFNTANPTINPTANPTINPTVNPTISPLNIITSTPTLNPSQTPYKSPTSFPTTYATNVPSINPTNSLPNDIFIQTSVTEITHNKYEFLFQWSFTEFIRALILFGIGCCCASCLCVICILKYVKSNNVRTVENDNEIELEIVDNSPSSQPSNNIDEFNDFEIIHDEIIVVEGKKDEIITCMGDTMEECDDDILQIKNWLTLNCDLPEYHCAFVLNGYESLEFIKSIESKSDLIEIGIVLNGHCNKILCEIQKLKTK